MHMKSVFNKKEKAGQKETWLECYYFNGQDITFCILINHFAWCNFFFGGAHLNMHTKS
jgi:hypothetical protein